MFHESSGGTQFDADAGDSTALPEPGAAAPAGRGKAKDTAAAAQKPSRKKKNATKTKEKAKTSASPAAAQAAAKAKKAATKRVAVKKGTKAAGAARKADIIVIAGKPVREGTFREKIHTMAKTRIAVSELAKKSEAAKIPTASWKINDMLKRGQLKEVK